MTTVYRNYRNIVLFKPLSIADFSRNLFVVEATTLRSQARYIIQQAPYTTQWVLHICMRVLQTQSLRGVMHFIHTCLFLALEWHCHLSVDAKYFWIIKMINILTMVILQPLIKWSNKSTNNKKWRGVTQFTSATLCFGVCLLCT